MPLGGTCRCPYSEMRSWIAIALAAALLLGAGIARGEVLLNGVGRWDLHELGGGELDLPTEQIGSERSLSFGLPKRVRQGPRTWYLMRLHAVVELARDTGSGIAYVGGSTNERAAALIKFKVKQRPGKPPLVRWSSINELRGPVGKVVSGTRIEFRYSNFLQNRGVRPGNNLLTFDFERLDDGVKLERVRVLADSGISISKRSPAHLRLDAVLPRGRVSVGETFAIGYKLRNTGDRTAYGVGVGLQGSSRALRIARPAIRRIGRIRRAQSGTFRVRARRAGRHRLTLSAGSLHTNDPEIEIGVPVSPSAGTGWARR